MQKCNDSNNMINLKIEEDIITKLNLSKETVK